MTEFVKHAQFDQILEDNEFVYILSDALEKGKDNVFYLLSIERIQTKVINYCDNVDSQSKNDLIRLFNIINRSNKIKKIKNCINDKSRI